jgi:hypothetical protein
MVCDTVRHRPPAPVSLAGAAGAAGATAATALIVPTDLRRPGMAAAAAAATRFGSGAGDDWTTGDEDHREVDATLIAEAMSLLYSIRVRTVVGCMDGSFWSCFISYCVGSKVGHCGLIR